MGGLVVDFAISPSKIQEENTFLEVQWLISKCDHLSSSRISVGISLWEMHILGPLSRPTDSEALELMPNNPFLEAPQVVLTQAKVCCCCSVLIQVWLFATPETAARQASLSFTNSRSLLKLMPIESVIPSNHLILCRPLLLLPLIFPSIRGFSNEVALCIRWPKYWNFSISPSNEYSGLISFRMDWLDLLAVQGTLKSLLQHHSSKASILLCSAFFMVQLSPPYMTTGKTIALIIWTFVGNH